MCLTYFYLLSWTFLGDTIFTIFVLLTTSFLQSLVINLLMSILLALLPIIICSMFLDVLDLCKCNLMSIPNWTLALICIILLATKLSIRVKRVGNLFRNNFAFLIMLSSRNTKYFLLCHGRASPPTKFLGNL